MVATTLAAATRRDRWIISGCIALAVALAWAYLADMAFDMVAMDDGTMSGMGSAAAMKMPMSSPWQAGTLVSMAVICAETHDWREYPGIVGLQSAT